MKKAILISIRPEWVEKILNGEKTIEIRKTVPKCELPIDVYIYCSKGKSLQECEFWSFEYPGSFKAFVAFSEEAPVGKEQFFWVYKNSLGFDGDNTVLATIEGEVRQEINDFESSSFEASPSINGKIVAKFTMKNADEFNIGNPYEESTRALLGEACVTIAEARRYAGGKHPYYLCRNTLYAWHISDLEVFDEPKKLSDFGRLLDKGAYPKADYLSDAIREGRGEVTIQQEKLMAEKLFSINRAPQSWCYVEVEG